MKKTLYSTLLLLLSLSANAGPEAGGLVGYSLMSASSGADPKGGVMLGVRGGFRTGSGTVIDAQLIRNSSASSGMSSSEMLMGVGLRYFIIDGGISPFASGHINYHMGSNTSSGGQTTSNPDSSGIGVDVGGGLKINITDLIYTDLFTHYSLQFTGKNRHNTLGFGLGAGVSF